MTAMRFRNFGGIHQFMVTGDADLGRIDGLDPARWAATSAPLRDLHCDPAFLACLDPDGTGRLRVSQLVAARDWLYDRLARREHLAARSEVLELDALDFTTEAGRSARAAAEHLIRQLGLVDGRRVPLADLRTFRSSYQKLLANGDGVIPPEVLPEEEVAELVKEMMPIVGSARDGSGADGVGQAELERFVGQGRAWLEWRSRESQAAPRLGARLDVAALGPVDCAAAAELVASLDGKIEEYFWHCDLLRQEGHSAEQLRLKEDELRLLPKDAQTIEKYLAGSPIATPVADGHLPLGGAINPVYRERFEALRQKVLAPLVGAGTRSLNRDGWRKARSAFDAWFAWQKERPPEPFEKIGDARLREILDGPLPDRVAHYIALDTAAAAELKQLQDLEKLILYQRWLIDLVNNFVNFSAIYRPEERALVEMGSMVIDGRRLDFCVKIEDRGAHRKVASESLIFLVYAQVLAKDTGAAAYEVMAPVTAGERGRLRVGKRGLFIDNDGREWDAVVVELVENPISVKEAALAPFRRAAGFISKKFEDWIGSQQKSQDRALAQQADRATDAAQKSTDKAMEEAVDEKGAPPAPAPTPAPAPAPAPTLMPGKKEEGGLNINTLILGGGMALAGLGAVLAGLFAALTSLKGWFAISGAVAAVAALSGLLGWLKLRRRDMSLLLEASGWAVNVNMKINRRIGRLFTHTPSLPKGSVIERVDLLATDEDRRRAVRRRISIAVALVVLIAAAAAAGWHYYSHRHDAPEPAPASSVSAVGAGAPAKAR
jgi:hypothetical protein